MQLAMQDAKRRGSDELKKPMLPHRYRTGVLPTIAAAGSTAASATA
ncbi:unnamed protein product, partial [Phaeothamnion confervicola]